MSGGGLVPGEKGESDKSSAVNEGYGMGQMLPPQFYYDFTQLKSIHKEEGGKVVEDKEELTELGGAIGMPDLIEHQTQLVDSLRKEEGYEDVNFMDVVQYPDDKGRLVSMPQQQLFPILNASDAWKASDAKRTAAIEMDQETGGSSVDPRETAKAVGLNKGGTVPGSGNKDTVPAMLTPGEFVMSKGAVQKVGVENLMQMNAAGGGTNQPTLMKVKAFAGGGMVSPPDPPSGSVNTVIPPSSPPGSTSGGGGGAPKNAKLPVIHAMDEGNSALLIVKSIYNIVG